MKNKIKTKMQPNQTCFGDSLVVQWLGLHAFTAQGAGSIFGWGPKIRQAMHPGVGWGTTKPAFMKDVINGCK